jgi:hypothetical protein
MSEEIQDSQINATVEPSEGVVDQTTEVNSVTPAEVSEDTIQEEVTEPVENKVPVSEIVAERQKKRAAEERTKVLEQELEQLRQRTAPQQPQQKNPFEGLEDEDLVNVRSAKEYVDTNLAKIKQDVEMMRVANNAAVARMKYPDYDDVIKNMQNVVNVDQFNILMKGATPAESTYLFIKASPQYVNTLAKDTVKKTAQETIDKIKSHTNQVKTLSKSGSSTSKNESVFKSMSEDELSKVEAAVMMGNQKLVDQYFK